MCIMCIMCIKFCFLFSIIYNKCNKIYQDLLVNFMRDILKYIFRKETSVAPEIELKVLNEAIGVYHATCLINCR